MTRATRSLTLAFLLLGLGACESRTDRTDGGGVLLTFGNIDWVAIYDVSASIAAGGAVIDTIVLQSVAKDPNGVTSSLMDIELRSFEVTFTRADGGTVVPPPLVRGFPGVIPVNGSLTIDGLVFLFAPQLENPPLSDLLLVNGGFDRETGNDFVLLNVSLRFFGRTLSGDEVQTIPLTKTVQFFG